MFVVEWRDMMYTTQAYTCTYQAVFYDVTNEIEFRYDNACRNYRDAATVGFMDQTKTKGQTIRHSTSTQNLYGMQTLTQTTTESQHLQQVTVRGRHSTVERFHWSMLM